MKKVAYWKWYTLPKKPLSAFYNDYDACMNEHMVFALGGSMTWHVQASHLWKRAKKKNQISIANSSCKKDVEEKETW